MGIKRLVHTTTARLLYALVIVLLGLCAGACCWAFFALMNAGIRLLWATLLQALGLTTSWWPLVLCTIGGILVGLFQRRWPGLPRDMHEVMADVRQHGRFEYRYLLVSFVGALLPLLFGGSIGPEAGLTGVIAGLSTWVGDRLRFLGIKFRDLASLGLSGVLAAMFSAPLYGLAVPILDDGQPVTQHKRIAGKPLRITVYMLTVLAALAAMMGLNHWFGHMGGLPRFSELRLTVYEWKWLIPLAAAGAILGWLSHGIAFGAARLSKVVGNRPMTKAIVAGLVLGAVGCSLPLTMFAGEEQALELQSTWTLWGMGALLATALVKPIIVQVCLQFGWRGGKFFPMIFSGIALGYAMAMLTSADAVFCVSVCAAAVMGAVMCKPFTAVLLLILCFPLEAVVPMIAASMLGAALPLPYSWRQTE
ncbi:chloride channel [Bifidobacterium dolichotidis]|uniref:Chloride channel n=1 Tax=Bifidobacterium dolichotidis TaxID=2306976 RepID=A0A430FSS4_9BIFI|nr:chloride channel protein [Bifidobacterium dolichotidis]RSX55932.1 chloride channel [Bifidobacterium dolichotidis]